MLKNSMAVVGGVVLGIATLFGLGYLTWALIYGPGRAIRTLDVQIDREVTQNSQQYVESQVRAMRDQIVKYQENSVEIAKLERDSKNAQVVSTIKTQQQGILRFVKNQAKTIPADALPEDIRSFLR